MHLTPLLSSHAVSCLMKHVWLSGVWKHCPTIISKFNFFMEILELIHSILSWLLLLLLSIPGSAHLHQIHLECLFKMQDSWAPTFKTQNPWEWGRGSYIFIITWVFKITKFWKWMWSMAPTLLEWKSMKSQIAS